MHYLVITLDYHMEIYTICLRIFPKMQRAWLSGCPAFNMHYHIPEKHELNEL